MASRSSEGGTVLKSGITTRKRKERKLYSDDWALGDEEIEGHHTFDLDEKVRNDKFNVNYVKNMDGVDFSLSYVQKHGFNWPLLFPTKDVLGITIPGQEFSINDVRLSVGSRRMLDVMDVNTQKNVEMTMKDWQRYYESHDKDKLLNVISLEFSHTKLETIIQPPKVVKQIDWVESVWPRHLKEAQTEATNVLEDMMYPKVQKYCLMSVKGCYTDFHIDFGGTSVWYHVLKGRKIFWLIPPTERNLQLYEQWVLSGKQGDIFFGDTVDRCARVELVAGNTFFIPTGWIHAVYTPDDSLVFGGNFLHSFGIEKQLRVAQVEDTTHVPQKFRYPFFTEMLWYLLERYVHVLLGHSHLKLPKEEQEKLDLYLKNKKGDNNNQIKQEPKEESEYHLTQYELHGLKAVVMYLHALPTSKKCVPELIIDPIALIRDVRTVVEKHRYDSPELAITDKPILVWWHREPNKFGIKRPIDPSAITIKKQRCSMDDGKSNSVPPNFAKVRYRRIRCKVCDACTREDCRQCTFCMDMIKYGGNGTYKQSCKMKKCIRPMLPGGTAVCYLCQLDGWYNAVGVSNSKNNKIPLDLYECVLCQKVSHLNCSKEKYPDVKGAIKEDFPCSWLCNECIYNEYDKEYKVRVHTGNSQPTSDIGSDAKSPLNSESELAEIKPKLEPTDSCSQLSLTATNGDHSVIKAKEEESNEITPPMPTWEQLQSRVDHPLAKPIYVIRPIPPVQINDDDDINIGGNVNPLLKPPILKCVFRYFNKTDLFRAMQVCRLWNRVSLSPPFWDNIDLSLSIISTNMIEGIIRRQPNSLKLDWSKITREQFSWLIQRLPQMESLSVVGLSWEEISFLHSPYCPALTALDLSCCEGIYDMTLSLLLSPPRTHRPGHRDTTTRLRQLKSLSLASTQITDNSIRVIASTLPFLTYLDLSGCLRITEMSLEMLAHSSSVVSHSLNTLDLRGCHNIGPMCLPSIASLPLISKLLINPCEKIPSKAISVWGKHFGYNIDEEMVMTRMPKPINFGSENMLNNSESFLHEFKPPIKSNDISESDKTPLKSIENFKDKSKNDLNSPSPKKTVKSLKSPSLERDYTCGSSLPLLNVSVKLEKIKDPESFTCSSKNISDLSKPSSSKSGNKCGKSGNSPIKLTLSKANIVHSTETSPTVISHGSKVKNIKKKSKNNDDTQFTSKLCEKEVSPDGDYGVTLSDKDKSETDGSIRRSERRSSGRKYKEDVETKNDTTSNSNTSESSNKSETLTESDVKSDSFRKQLKKKDDKILSENSTHEGEVSLPVSKSRQEKDIITRSKRFKDEKDSNSKKSSSPCTDQKMLKRQKDVDDKLKKSSPQEVKQSRPIILKRDSHSIKNVKLSDEAAPILKIKMSDVEYSSKLRKKSNELDVDINHEKVTTESLPEHKVKKLRRTSKDEKTCSSDSPSSNLTNTSDSAHKIKPKKDPLNDSFSVDNKSENREPGTSIVLKRRKDERNVSENIPGLSGETSNNPFNFKNKEKSDPSITLSIKKGISLIKYNRDKNETPYVKDKTDVEIKNKNLKTHSPLKLSIKKMKTDITTPNEKKSSGETTKKEDAQVMKKNKEKDDPLSIDIKCRDEQSDNSSNKKNKEKDAHHHKKITTIKEDNLHKKGKDSEEHKKLTRRPSDSSISSNSSSITERSSSRERPERQHRSPRRLSMCQ